MGNRRGVLEIASFEKIKSACSTYGIVWGPFRKAQRSVIAAGRVRCHTTPSHHVFFLRILGGCWAQAICRESWHHPRIACDAITRYFLFCFCFLFWRWSPSRHAAALDASQQFWDFSVFLWRGEGRLQCTRRTPSFLG